MHVVRLGAGTANAAEGDANISGNAITVISTDDQQLYTQPVDTNNLQSNLCTFKYVEFAKYVANGAGGVQLEGVATADAVNDAFTAVGYDASNTTYRTQQDWLGSIALTAQQTTEFVNALKDSAITDITPTASNDGTTLTFTFTEGGLYLIVYQSGELTIEDNATHKLVWAANKPFLAGTAITGANPNVNNATGVLGTNIVDAKSTEQETFKAGSVSWQKAGTDGVALTVLNSRCTKAT